MNKKGTIGFSTGCFYKIADDQVVRLEMIRELGIKTAELMLNDPHYVFDLDIAKVSKISRDFEHLSIHAPVRIDFSYGNGSKSEQAVIARLEKICSLIDITVVVFHPDTIVDFEVVGGWNFPVALENSDWRKVIGKTFRSMKMLIKKAQVPMVLDVNHIFSNDRSMESFENYTDEFGEHIAEFHVSGFDKEKLHIPLHSVDQKNLAAVLPFVRQHGAPIIIESAFEKEDGESDFRGELEFVSYQGEEVK
jgi:endonuclease IV